MPEPFSPLSEREVSEGLWVLEHRKVILKITTVALLIVDVLFGGAVLVGLVREIGSWSDRRRMEQDLVAPLIVRAVESPAALVANNIQTVMHAATMDLVVEVQNPNAEFGAVIEYTFTSEGNALGRWDDVLAPATTSHFVALGVPRAQGAIEFQPLLVRWQRTNAHTQGTYASWKSSIGDVVVSKSARENTDHGSAVQFTLFNNSALHLQHIPVVILLLSGESLVGVNEISVDRLGSGQKRDVDVRWSESLPVSTSLLIEPHVDLLDQWNRFVPEYDSK